MPDPAAPAPTSVARGLLAVHAHPDDETLSNGALLSSWAAAGSPVTVVTCTRGEQGEVIVPALASLAGDGPALAAHREVELAHALAALGVGDHVFLDQVRRPDDGAETVRYLDSGMAWVGAGRAGAVGEPPPGAFSAVDLEEAADRLATIIVDRRPEVVVGYEPGGGYGHPDHVHAHRVMQRAVELAAPQHEVPVVLWTVLDEPAWRAACADLAAAPVTAGLTVPDAGGPAPSSAVPSDRVDVTVEVEPVLDRLLTALRAHRTQVQAISRWAGCPTAVARCALSNGVLQPVLRVETYRIGPHGLPGGHDAAGGRGAALDRAALRTRAARVTWPTGVRVVAR